MKFQFAQIVGRYRLVVSGELLAFIERTFVDSVPLEQREGVRAEARHEAEGAEIEFRADGTFISRSGSQEFFRVTFEPDQAEHEELTFQKTTGERVRLRLVDSETVVAAQSGRPPAEFRRVE